MTTALDYAAQLGVPPAGVIALSRLVFVRNVPAGADWSVIGLWACRQRKTADPVDPAVWVIPIGPTGLFRVTDGRHRVMGAILAGRTEIAYRIDPERDAEAAPGLAGGLFDHPDLRAA